MTTRDLEIADLRAQLDAARGEETRLREAAEEIVRCAVGVRKAWRAFDDSVSAETDLGVTVLNLRDAERKLRAVLNKDDDR